MSDLATAVAATVTVLTLLALTVRQILTLRPESRAPRWLSAVCVLLVVGFLVASASRLSTAL
jgi:multisubunit Na+/H+ antiporter MnhB subunit